MASDPATLTPALPRDSTLTLLAAGRKAFSQVPGLRRHLVIGFVLLYGLTFAVGIVAVGAAHYYGSALLPDLGEGDGIFMGVLVFLGSVLLWIVEVILIAAAAVLSFLVSLSMMSVWFEAMVGRIVLHHRGGGESGGAFDLSAWLGSIGSALVDSLGLLLLAVAALALVFIPVIGPFLVVVIESYLLGREVRDPYLAFRAGEGPKLKQLRQGLGLWTMRVGFVPFFLALVPIAGWLLLPMVMIYLVAGFAWQGELARAAGNS